MVKIRKVLFFKRFLRSILDYFDLYEPVTEMNKGDILEIIDYIQKNNSKEVITKSELLKIIESIKKEDTTESLNDESIDSILDKINNPSSKKQDIIGKNESFRKFRKKVKFTFYTIVFFITIFGAFGPGLELYNAYKEKKATNEAIKNLNNVSSTMYFRENSPEVALKIIDKSLSIDDENADTLYLKSFIESMLTVELIKNLDRPYNKDELLKAQTAMANAEFILESGNEEFFSKAYLIKAQTYFALEDNKRALIEIEKAIENDPDTLFYKIRKASILVESGKYDVALRLLEKLDRNYNDQKDKKHIYLWQGITYFQLYYSSNGDDKVKYYTLMKEKYEKALEVDDKFHLAMINLGKTYAESNDGNKDNNKEDRLKAIELYKEVLKLRPGNKKAYYLLGKLYGAVDKYEKAELYFKKALEIDSNYYSANLFLGMVYYELEDYPQSLKYYNKALLLNPQAVDAYFMRANTNKKLKNYKDAIKDYLEVIDESSDRYYLYMSYISRAEISIEMKMPSHALEFLNEAKKYDDELDETYFRAEFKYHKGLNEFEKAIKSIDKAITLSNKLKNSLRYSKALYLFENTKLKESLESIKDMELIEKAGLHEKVLKLEYTIYSNLLDEDKMREKLMEIRKYDPLYK